MITLGFNSAIVPDLSFEEVIDFASNNNFKSVELMCWPIGKADRRYAGVTHIDVNNVDDKKISYIRNYVHSKNVEISALGYYPNPLHEDLEKREFYISHLKKVIEVASKLNVGIVNTFIGRMQSKNIDENLQEFKKVWTPIVQLAEQYNVKISIENCPMFFTNDEWPAGTNLAISPSIWKKMFELIPSSNLGLNYDPSHMIWQQMDYVKPIYEFKDRIFYVHIKDSKVIKDKLDQVGILATPSEYHTPKLPGLGDIDWGKFFSALTDIRYEGHAVIEVEDRAFEGSLENRKKSLIQSQKFIRQFVE